MDWITEEHNRRNQAAARRQAIARIAPTLWQNVCQDIDRAVKHYRSVSGEFILEFSGCANHTFYVAVFERQDVLGNARGTERERVSISFDREASAIEAVFSRDTSKVTFPMTQAAEGLVSLTHQGREISTERFTEIVLRDMLFPPQ